MNVLIQALTDRLGYPHLEAAAIDGFLQGQPQPVALFFSGDPDKAPESNDVAVVLPELVHHFQGRFGAAVITDPGPQLQAHYGFSRWPALVFMLGRQHLGSIVRVQNWSDYLGEIETILQAEPHALPGFPIPVVSQTSGCSTQ